MNKIRTIFFQSSKLAVPISFPFFIVVMSVLLLFQPWFLQYEYGKASFPADTFGFTDEVRSQYGLSSMEYIVAFSPPVSIDALSDESGKPIYTEREAHHMRDVRNVFQTVRFIWSAALIYYVFLILINWRTPSRISEILMHFKMGSVFTIGLTLFLLAGSLLAFDWLFSCFHRLFFVEGSWLFFADDTLIRLFPQKLWVDAFITAGIFTFIYAVILSILFHRSWRQIKIS